MALIKGIIPIVTGRWFIRVGTLGPALTPASIPATGGRYKAVPLGALVRKVSPTI